MFATPIITVKEYFSRIPQFVIPHYQRGYKWGVPSDNDSCAVSTLMDNLLDACARETPPDYYLQGVTVYEENGEVFLIDGQQRTTTLLLLLGELGQKHLLTHQGRLKIRYEVRPDSHNYLTQMLGLPAAAVADEDLQDICYFKKAQATIAQKLKQREGVVSREVFKEYLLTRVHLIYISISKDKATKAFEMLNGQKAFMKAEELIKAELLAKTARTAPPSPEATENPGAPSAAEWEIHALRSKYAREWDKWLYWWNRKEVKSFFATRGAPLGLLLEYFYREQSAGNKEFVNSEREAGQSFIHFKEAFLPDSLSAKNTFKQIRDLQKCFEDLFHTTEIYNLLGLALATANQESRTKFQVIRFFMKHKGNLPELRRYAKWALVHCTHLEITGDGSTPPDRDAYLTRKMAARKKLEGRAVYFNEAEGKPGVGKEDAYLQLLRLNVLELGAAHKFDFSVFGERSLEHVCPQTPVDAGGRLAQQEILEHAEGIHSIGNLVLLNGSTNSELSNKPFTEKKTLLFEKIKRGLLLPHTLIVFSKSFPGAAIPGDLQDHWASRQVQTNASYFFTQFDRYYDECN